MCEIYLNASVGADEKKLHLGVEKGRDVFRTKFSMRLFATWRVGCLHGVCVLKATQSINNLCTYNVHSAR